VIEAEIESAARPFADSAARAKVASILAGSGTFTSLVAPAMQAQAEATARVQAQLRCLRVLNAVLRLEQSNANTDPTLAKLDLPLDATTDPYNGQPLQLRKSTDGWVVYSVGRKLKDGGGGNLGGAADQDVGIGPIKR